MFFSLPNLLLTALIQLLLLPNIQSCPYLTSLDSSPGGQLAASNLRGNHGSDHHDNRQLQSVSSASSSSPTSSPSYPTSTSSNPFCVKTNGRPPKLSTKGIQTAVKAIKTLFYGQLSAYANNTLALSDILGQSIYIFDWLFTMPLKLISRTPPTSWDLMDALVIQLQTKD